MDGICSPYYLEDKSLVLLDVPVYFEFEPWLWSLKKSVCTWTGTWVNLILCNFLSDVK